MFMSCVSIYLCTVNEETRQAQHTYDSIQNIEDQYVPRLSNATPQLGVL